MYCHRGRANIVADSECANLPKPAESAKCQMMNCPEYHWTTTSWSNVMMCDILSMIDMLYFSVQKFAKKVNNIDVYIV